LLCIFGVQKMKTRRGNKGRKGKKKGTTRRR
jgi:hypothetical protein